MLTSAFAVVPLSLATHVNNTNVVVSLQPSTVRVNPGDTFSLKLNIANVADLDGWEFTVVFDPTIVIILPTSAYIYEGFTSPATDPLTVKRAITLDNEFGTVAAGATAFPLPASGITGTGNLFRMDFSVLPTAVIPAAGSPIEFFDLLLRSVTPTGAIEIITPVSITGTTVLPGVAEDFTISASPSSLTINVGFSGTSTITLMSIGGFVGTVNLAASVSPATGLACTLSPGSVPLTSGGSGTSTLTCSATLVGNYVVNVTGASGTKSHFTIVNVKVVDFGISASPTSLSMNVGESRTSTITVTSINGFSSPVGLSSSVSPVPPAPATGLSCTLDPTIVTPPGSTTSTLRCNATAGGNYDVTVTGTSNALSHSVIIPVAVAQPGIGISASPDSVTINVGSSGTSTITLTSLRGFVGTVSLSSTVLPTSGLSCSLSPSSVPLTSGGSGTSTLTCNATLFGNYVVTVTGTSGTISNSTTVSFRVVDFRLDDSPDPVNILVGQSGTSTITVTSVNGFSSPVGLSSSVSPVPPAPATGLSCTLDPTIVTPPGSTTSTLTCKGTIAGAYDVTVTGTSGTLIRTTTVRFNVGPEPTFDLSDSPDPVTINVGSMGTSTITVTSRFGFSSPVDLSSSVSPAMGLSCSVSPTPVTPPADGSTTSTLTCNGTIVGTYTVTVTGTSGTKSSTTTVTFNVVDFSLSDSPDPVTIKVSESGTSTITVASINGFSSPVGLSASVSPATGLSCTLSPTSVTPPASGSAMSTLTCNGAIVGTYTVTVTGTSGSLSHSTTVTFNVVDFSVSADPTEVIINVNEMGSSTISITGINGFAGTVSLSVSFNATGLSCPSTLPSATLPPDTTRTLTCAGLVAGDYTVTVTGTDPTSHMAEVIFKVRDFSLSASPTALSIKIGSSGSSTITVTGINMFAGTVNLSSSVLPATGLSCTLDPTSVMLTLGGSGTSALMCNASLVGNYVVTVTGTIGILSRSTTVTVNVVDFSLSAVPDTFIGDNAIAVGGSAVSTISVVGSSGFSDTVSLSVSVSPVPPAPATGLSCTLNPPSITPDRTSTLTCTATAAGNYTATVTGTSLDPLSRSVDIRIEVKPRVDCKAIQTSPLIVFVTEKVNFTAVIEGTVGAVMYSWDFDGDGVQDAANPTPTFIYTSTGSFTPTLTVTDSRGPSFGDTCDGIGQDEPPVESILVNPEPEFIRGKLSWKHHLTTSAQTWTVKARNPSTFTVNITVTIVFSTDSGTPAPAPVVGIFTLAPGQTILDGTISANFPGSDVKYCFTATLTYRPIDPATGNPLPGSVVGTDKTKSGCFADVAP